VNIRRRNHRRSNFSAVNALLLRPLAYADPDELVMVLEAQPQYGRMSVAYPNYVDYRDNNASFDGLAAYRRDSMNLTGKGEPERLAVAQYSRRMLPVLGVEPALGRNFVAEEDAPRGPRAVLLTHAFWTRRFAADPGLVGREITLDASGSTPGSRPRTC
jgi:putative ABC transport system permease protein